MKEKMSDQEFLDNIKKHAQDLYKPSYEVARKKKELRLLSHFKETYWWGIIVTLFHSSIFAVIAIIGAPSLNPWVILTLILLYTSSKFRKEQAAYEAFTRLCINVEILEGKNPFSSDEDAENEG